MRPCKHSVKPLEFKDMKVKGGAELGQATSQSNTLVTDVMSVHLTMDEQARLNNTPGFLQAQGWSVLAALRPLIFAYKMYGIRAYALPLQVVVQMDDVLVL